MSTGYNELTLLVFQSSAAATVKAEVPKVDPVKGSKPAAVAAATAPSAQGNVSVQKKDEAKPSHTKVERPARQQEAVKHPSCAFSDVFKAPFLPFCGPLC